MKFYPIGILIMLMLISSHPTYAQFGKLKKLVGKKDDRKSVYIDWDAQKLLPAISLSSLLSNDGLKLELDGTLKINSLEISFLPKKDKKGEIINYDPYKRKDFVLSADLYKKGAKNVIHTFYFTVNPVSSPFSLMSAIHRPNDDMHQSVAIEEGDYFMKFHVAQKHVHSFSFSVVKATNDDAYAAMSELYFLDGDWRKYGRLSFNKTVTGKALMFEKYILNNTTDVENEHRPNKQKEIEYNFKLYRDGQIVAANNVNSDGEIYNSTGASHRGYWNIAGSQCVKYPAKMDRNGARNEYFTEKDMVDGNYKIELEQTLFSGGSSKEQYNFKVKNGKIVPLEKANRSKYHKTDDLIEQGRDHHFVTITN